MTPTRIVSMLALLATAALSAFPALAGGPYQFYTLAPCRMVDTRQLQPPSPLSAGVVRLFSMKGTCGVPAGAEALAVTVTATQGTPFGGHVTIYPGNLSAPPLVSTVNFRPGEDIANGAIVPIASTPTNDLAVVMGGPAGNTVHVIVDVVGYYK